MIPAETIDTTAEILTTLHSVMDPEIPALSIVDLGIIGKIIVDDHFVKVKLIPTFIACPAIRHMQEMVKSKILSMGFRGAEVELDRSVAWSSDRISDVGKKKLEEFGLGIPLKHGGEFNLEEIENSKCPHCGSSNTSMNSLFGSSLCRSIHYCYDCRQGFERFKPV
jgi:ring-1,2-phenylacetyl-CoA epoxidase subunit PaaD